MQRTKYYNDTRPADTQLNYTESSRVSAIRRRLLAAAQMGVVEGFRITVNSLDATKIDIGAGEGYTGGTYLVNTFEGAGAGERISTTTDTVTGTISVGNIIQGQALADYTLNTKNYVSLVYSEDESYPLAERSFPFTAHDTVVSDGYSVSVMTETAWNSLVATDINKRVLLAIVTAKGAGTALTSADIDQVVQPRTHPTTSQPSSITGAEIIGISPETGLGNSTLRFDPSTSSLFWTAPSDVEGAPVLITSSGSYPVYSDNTSYYITVSVTFASLPTAAVSETIEVRGLYGRTIPLFSPKDTAHRDLVGSGIPTRTNPHGLTFNDLPGGTFDHADYFHVNGISSDSVSTLLQCSADGLNERILINNPGGANDKYLVDGRQYTTVTGAAAGTDGVVNFNVLPLPDDGRYLIYLDSSGTPGRVKIAETLWDSDIRVLDTHVSVTGNATLAWDAALNTLTFTAPGDAAGDPVVVALGSGGLGGPVGIYKVYSNNGVDWVLVYTDGGVLGVTSSTTYAVEKSDADGSLTADELILKLGVVTWDSAGGTLTDLDDLRLFMTADSRDVLLEEHASNGQHTKMFKHQLRAVDAYRAIYGSATENFGVYGSAATDYGVYASAGRSYGGYGRASTIGLGGYALAVTGVYGTAPNYGGVFKAAAVTGIYASASDEGIYVEAQVDTAIYASAGKTYGVEASASLYGGSFHASTYGVQGQAVGTYGVAGLAAHLAGYFVASMNNPAQDIVGAYGQASNPGDEARAIGVQGYAGGANATGVYGRAPSGVGVYGTGGPTGVRGYGNVAGGYFSATGGGGAGVYGINTAAGALGGSFEGSRWGALVTADTGLYAAGGTAIYCDGLFDYNQGWVAAAGITSYVPIRIQGIAYKLAIYT